MPPEADTTRTSDALLAARAAASLGGSCLLPSQVVAVTGASRGIGRAIIRAVAVHGAGGVCIHCYGDEQTRREADELVEDVAWLTEGKCEAIVVSGDIALPEVGKQIVATTIERFGRLDVLVSNAGICPFSSFLDLTPPLWTRTQDVNLNGAFHVLHAAATAMATQPPDPLTGARGVLIAISSISALVGGSHQAHYTPTKAGLKSLVESMAISLGPLGIRCNCVLPGTISTAINQDQLDEEGGEKRRRMEERTPLGRLGNPEDIAGVVVFLASQLSRYMQGASILVDGGAFVNLQ